MNTNNVIKNILGKTIKSDSNSKNLSSNRPRTFLLVIDGQKQNIGLSEMSLTQATAIVKKRYGGKNKTLQLEDENTGERYSL